MPTLLAFTLGATLATALLWAAGRHLIGFAAQRPPDYAGTTPQFDLRALSGPMICEGVIYGPLGRVAARFVGHFEGHWDGNRGRLREHFRYDSGTEQTREWILTMHNDGTFDAEAADLVGTGRGQAEGAAVRLDYAIRLPESAGGYVLHAVDWMYMLENGTIVNRSQMRKFGIPVAELVATIRKVDA